MGWSKAVCCNENDPLQSVVTVDSLFCESLLFLLILFFLFCDLFIWNIFKVKIIFKIEILTNNMASRYKIFHHRIHVKFLPL